MLELFIYFWWRPPDSMTDDMCSNIHLYSSRPRAGPPWRCSQVGKACRRGLGAASAEGASSGAPGRQGLSGTWSCRQKGPRLDLGTSSQSCCTSFQAELAGGGDYKIYAASLPWNYAPWVDQVSRQFCIRLVTQWQRQMNSSRAGAISSSFCSDCS